MRGRKCLIEGEPDGLNRNIGRSGLLEERSQNSRGNVATAANSNHCSIMSEEPRQGNAGQRARFERDFE